jgi:Na+/H+ antiporter NhaC
MMNMGHTSSFMTAGIIVQHIQYLLPTSCTMFLFVIVVYIFLQYYKQLTLKHIFEMRAIIYCNRYVDDTSWQSSIPQLSKKNKLWIL